MGFFKNLLGKPKSEKIADALFVTKKTFIGKLTSFFTGKIDLFDEFIEELEDILIAADIGIDTTFFILEKLEKIVKKKKLTSKEDVFSELKKILIETLDIGNHDYSNEAVFTKGETNVVIVVGVNGVGKTTTIAKIANLYAKNDFDVVLGAADTFRAAAIHQLSIWAERIQIPIIKRNQGDDPGAVAHDLVNYAISKQVDIAIIDTAGRLQNKTPLMDELSKVCRVVKKNYDKKDPQVWLILDGTTGQNGIEQAKHFKESTNVTGIIVTKLDGTSKGGIIFSISHELKLPILFIGVGEKVEDITPFSTQDFVNSLFE